jgi:hypothetical protein
MSTSRTRQVSTKVNCETCEKLRQSAQSSAAVPEQCGRRIYSGAAEQKRKSGILCLPGFVEDRGKISFSRGGLIMEP